MWSNMWSKAILDQSRGEVKKKKCQRRNGFSDWLISRVQTVLQHPKQARYQLRYTRLFSLFIRLGVFSQSTRPTNWAIPGFLRNIWGFVFAYFSPKWGRSQEEKMQVLQRFSERTRIFPINTK